MLSAPSHRCLLTVKHLGLVFLECWLHETLYLYRFYDPRNCPRIRVSRGSYNQKAFRCLEMFGVITVFAPETIPLSLQTEIRSNPCLEKLCNKRGWLITVTVFQYKIRNLINLYLARCLILLSGLFTCRFTIPLIISVFQWLGINFKPCFPSLLHSSPFLFIMPPISPSSPFKLIAQSSILQL